MVVIKQTDTAEQVKKKINQALGKGKEEKRKLFESFVGVIKIQEDPVVMQRRWRDDW